MKKEGVQKNQTEMLHIDLGNQSIANWVNKNKYIIHSELVRYCKILLENDLEYIEAILVRNFTDNVVFILKKDSIDLTLERAMEYFLSIEEYELCCKIRDVNILIEKAKNEKGDSKDSLSNKREFERY